MEFVKEKLESASEVDRVRFQPSEKTLLVSYEFSGAEEPVHKYSDIEVSLIREGKLTPLEGGGMMTLYDVHITLEEQDENTESKFNFV